MAHTSDFALCVCNPRPVPPSDLGFLMPPQPEHGPQSLTNNYASWFSHEPWTFRARGEDEILQSGGRRKTQASPHRALTHLELPLGKGLAPAVVCACRYVHVPGVRRCVGLGMHCLLHPGPFSTWSCFCPFALILRGHHQARSLHSLLCAANFGLYGIEDSISLFVHLLKLP